MGSTNGVSENASDRARSSARLDLRREVGRRHEVDVEGPAFLLFEKDAREPLDGDSATDFAACDGLVLAIDATQRATREEHRATSGFAADGRFLPEMQCGACEAHLIALAAHATCPLSVDGAATWA